MSVALRRRFEVVEYSWDGGGCAGCVVMRGEGGGGG